MGNPTVSFGNHPIGSRGGSNLHNAIKQTNEKGFCNQGIVQISSMSMASHWPLVKSMLWADQRSNAQDQKLSSFGKTVQKENKGLN